MAFSVTDCLVHNDEQDRETVGKELSKLWYLKQERPQLFQDLPHTVVAKVCKGAAANTKLENYKGPDAETVAYLEKTHANWISDPWAFWFPPAVGSSLSDLRPEAQMVGLYLQAWQSDM